MNLCTFAQVAPSKIPAHGQDDTHWLILRRDRMSRRLCEAFLFDGDTLEKLILEFLRYKFYFFLAEYSQKIHWARRRPLPQCEWNLGSKYLGPDGPGQLRLDSGSPQQAGFPYQMLSQGFWAATHLPFAVRLQNPLSSIGSSRRLIE